MSNPLNHPDHGVKVEVYPMEALSIVSRDRQMLGVVAGELSPMPINAVRNHSRYTAAQVNERDHFVRLLFELCRTVPGEIQTNGRPRHHLADVVFASVYRCYRGVSSRRFVCDLRDAQQAGLLCRSLSYNSLTHRLRDPDLTPILRSLIEGTAASFAHLETSFAVDSTGFPVPKMTRWCDAKYGWRRRREWVKCHAMVGVKSHIIAAVDVTPRDVMDPSRFKLLVDDTSHRFQIKDVAADRAYSTISNLEKVESLGAVPAIPFKMGTNPFRHEPGSTWSRMFHIFALNAPDYQERLNRQNQAEATFSMIKRRFGDKVFSKTETGQVNEVLCKVLGHNLCVILYWVHQFGLELPEIKEGRSLGETREVVDSRQRGDAFNKVSYSLDVAIRGTEISRSERVVDMSPSAFDNAINHESVKAIVERLMGEEGISRDDAWKVVVRLL